MGGMMMRPVFLFIGIGIMAAGCERAPEAVWIELTDVPVELSGTARTFVPKKPAPTDDEVVCLCVDATKEYDLHDDFTLGRSQSERVKLEADATLENGRTVPLPDLTSFGIRMLCLGPEQPLGVRVAQVSITASAPIIADRIAWVNTHK
jgi:hypothetical protein